MNSRRSVAFSLSIFLAALSLGCVSAPPKAPPNSMETVTPSPSHWTNSPKTDPPTTVPPDDPSGENSLSPYILTATEYATLDYAYQVATDSCMQRFGLNYPIIRYPSLLANYRASEQEMLSNRFGPTDLAYVSVAGYTRKTVAINDGPLVNVVTKTNDFVLYGGNPTEVRFPAKQKQSPGEFNGLEIPPGGCFGEAFRMLGDDGGIGWGSLGREIWVEVLSSIHTEKAYPKEISPWVKCMRDSGYSVTDPVQDDGDISNEIKNRQEDSPSQREISIAKADVNCKQSTDLVGRLSALEDKLARISATQNLTRLRANRQLLDNKINLAHSIINNYGGFR